MRLDKEIRRLSDTTRFLQCILESQRFELKRIIKLGIMLNLGITILNLSILILNLNSFTLKGKETKQDRARGRARDPVSMQKTKVENTLVYIPEVVREVGMNGVGHSGIPVSITFLFYPTLGVSALTKGAIVSKFLGYLYSRERIVENLILHDLLRVGCFGDERIFFEILFLVLRGEENPGSWFFSSYSYFLHQAMEEAPKPRGFISDPVRCFGVGNGVPFTQKGNVLVTNEVTSAGTLTYPAVQGYPNPCLRRIRIKSEITGSGLSQSLVRVSRRMNLIILYPGHTTVGEFVMRIFSQLKLSSGILVSLKQADEALRKGRNTLVKIDEIG